MIKKIFLLSLLTSSFAHSGGTSVFTEVDEIGLPKNLTPLQMEKFFKSVDIEDLLEKNTTTQLQIEELRKTFAREEITQKLPFLKLQLFYEKAQAAILTLKQKGHINPANEKTLALLEEKAASLEDLAKFTETVTLSKETILYLLADGLLAVTLTPQRIDGKIGHDCLLSMFFQTAKSHLDTINMGYELLAISLYSYSRCTKLIGAYSLDITPSFNALKAQHILASRSLPYIQDELGSIGLFADDVTYKFLDTSSDRNLLRTLIRENRKRRPPLQRFPQPKDSDITCILKLDTWSTSMRDRIEASDPAQILELYMRILDADMEQLQRERARKRREAKFRRKQRETLNNDKKKEEALPNVTSTSTDSTSSVIIDKVIATDRKEKEEELPTTLPTDQKKIDFTDTTPELTEKEKTPSAKTVDASEEGPDPEEEFRSSLTELFEYQKYVTSKYLEPKNSIATTKPEIPKLSSSSKELLTLLTEKSKDSVTFKHLRRFTPVVQLFDELGIRRSVKNNKIVSPRSGQEAFVLHMVHKEHNPHTLVNDLRKHLDAMTPEWRDYVYP